jgi:hypothetical protein
VVSGRQVIEVVQATQSWHRCDFNQQTVEQNQHMATAGVLFVPLLASKRTSGMVHNIFNIRLLTAEHVGEWMKLSLAIPCLIAFSALLIASLLHIERIPEGPGYFIVKRRTTSVKPMG